MENFLNLYPEQLRYIAAACEALNELSKSTAGTNSNLYLRRIEVMEENQVLGTIVDEIGGSHSFYIKGTEPGRISV